MWSKTNADKLKMELSGKRDKQQQQQSVKSEKMTNDDSINVKMDSGFLSGANLSSDMLSKESFEYEKPNDVSPKEPAKTVFDSGLDLDGESGCLSELDVDQKEMCKPCTKNEHYWKFYFQQNDDGDTQLHLAIIHEYTEISKQLIDVCSDSKYLDVRNDDGQTALHLAVLANQSEIVKYLMAANANAEILDCNGNTAVHLACYNGRLDCLRIFTNYVFLPKMFDTINYDGLACIHIATIANHLNVLRFILKSTKNVNIKDYKSGYTALHFAVALNRANIIKCLLDKVDENIESYAGKLAFEIGEDTDDDDDDDEDEEDNNEIFDDFVRSMNGLQLFNNSSVKC